MSAASAGAPLAGYSTSYSGLGKPPKSWMVAGCGVAVTVGKSAMKWAEATTMACGLGKEAPKWSRKRAVGESSKAIIGEPWERNREGSGKVSMRLRIRPYLRSAKHCWQVGVLRQAGQHWRWMQ